MKTTLLSLLFMTGVSMLSFGQTATLNQLDKDGKKDGRWLVYLDASGEKVKDSSAAVYKRYTWFDHGVNTQPMGAFIGKSGKIETTGATAKAAGSVLLDGEYKCFDKDGKLRYVHMFNNGEYVWYKEYNKESKLTSMFDYAKHCDGQEHSWHVYIYDDNGKITMEDCTKKEASGNWPRMRD